MKHLTLVLLLLFSVNVFAERVIERERSATKAVGDAVRLNGTLQRGKAMTSSDVLLYSEGFESDSLAAGWSILNADTDTFNWYVSKTEFNTGSRCMASASYISFIGPNFIGALTPDNYLISPRISIPSSASEVALNFYVSGNDANYPYEHYSVYASLVEPFDVSNLVLLSSETLSSHLFALRTISLSQFSGQQIRLVFRHHNCTDNYELLLDDVSVYTTSDPTITVDTDSLYFVSEVGSYQEVSLNVSGIALSSAISVQSSGPFQVSEDGLSFGSSLSLTGNVNTITIRYLPTSMGFHSGSVTFSASGVQPITVFMEGKGWDCGVRASDFEELFTDSSLSLSCWSFIDGNNDGISFYRAQTNYLSNKYMFVYRYSQVTDADDWLVSPLFDIKRGDSVHISYVCPYAPAYNERMQVYVLPEHYNIATDTVSLSELLISSGDSLMEISYNLSGFANRRMRVAIHCTSLKNNAELHIKDFKVRNYGLASVPGGNLSGNICYPNPVKDVVYLSVAASVVEVYSMNGVMLLRYDLQGNQSIHLDNLSSGVYMLRVTHPDGVSMEKIVKE